jgi:hypothetical protein
MDKLKELANFISTHCNQDDKLNSDFIQALYSYKYSSYLSTPSAEIVKDYIRIIERPNDLFLTDRENEEEDEEYYDEEDEIIENEDLNSRVEETTINIGGASYHYYNPSGQIGAGLENEESVLRRLTEQAIANELQRAMAMEARRNQAQNTSDESAPDLSPPLDAPF